VAVAPRRRAEISPWTLSRAEQRAPLALLTTTGVAPLNSSSLARGAYATLISLCLHEVLLLAALGRCFAAGNDSRASDDAYSRAIAKLSR